MHASHVCDAHGFKVVCAHGSCAGACMLELRCELNTVTRQEEAQLLLMGTRRGSSALGHLADMPSVRYYNVSRDEI